MIGGVLVVLIIFLFLRNVRSTLIICTSIPISVIGTFALLYFGGYTLNTLTFGGLALGIGMIVDAAIVVLENTYRHLEMGKDRMTAAIDGSEEVWSAILASTLTHIAVFVPMLFLTGVAQHHVRSAGRGRVVLAGDVAVRRGHHRAGALLALPAAAGSRRGSARACSARSIAGAIACSTSSTRSTRARCTRRSQHRPTVFATGVALFVAVALPGADSSASSCSRRPTKAKSPSTPSWRSARASRSPKAVLIGLEERISELVPEATMLITSASGGGDGRPGGGGVGTSRQHQRAARRPRTNASAAAKRSR